MEKAPQWVLLPLRSKFLLLKKEAVNNNTTLQVNVVSYMIQLAQQSLDYDKQEVII